MATEDTKGKKRKGATDAAPKAKKPRKSDDPAALTKPTKASKSAVVSTSADPKTTKDKTSRKQAADVFDDNEAPAKPTKGKKKAKAAAETNEGASESIVPAVEEPNADSKPRKQAKKGKPAVTEDALAVEAPKDKAKKSKKGKQTDVALVEEEAPVELQQETSSKKTKKTKGRKKQAETEEDAVAVAEAAAEADEIEFDGEEDDQTAALLAGFESDDDENDPEEDVDFDEDVNVPALTKKQKAALAKAAIGAKANEPGVIYVGRVPRGFFEPQMKKYFSQFGRVNKLRLSRNKQTGASKHYAFVEFASSEVADIVARTMDNYLLFGHILKCKVMPSDQVHPDLFKGAGQRFKVDPLNKKAGLEMERGAERAQWEKRIEKENKRRSGKTKALKEEFGYEFSAPAVKPVEDVPKNLQDGDAQNLLADAPAQETSVVEKPKANKGKKAVEATEDVQPIETAVPAAGKKRRDRRAPKSTAAAEAEAQVEPEVEPEKPAVAEAPVAEKKKTRGRKRKSDIAVETEEAPAAEAAPKSKKAKKDAKAAADTPEKKRKAKTDETAPPKKAKKAKA